MRETRVGAKSQDAGSGERLGPRGAREGEQEERTRHAEPGQPGQGQTFRQRIDAMTQGNPNSPRMTLDFMVAPERPGPEHANLIR